ncbi:PPE family protein [Mycobacterium riyadhense]|uniref:PPE family protein n=1 Tax=Mycobacterium riyadhense TaxID=486698 RepID=UPI001EF9D40A|nr:PPE family protein [Mycobacterium riyadhense]
MMSFLVSAPEIVSAQMYAGAGSAPMLAAAAAWEGLADELGTAANSFSSMISGLATSSWQGPASAAMVAVAAPYAQWLDAAATQAGGAAVGAKAVAAVFEAARGAVVHPLAIASNRTRLVSLVVSNLFGFNAPAIAVNEAEYEEMWAQDVAAMLSYHGGASAVAQQLMPWGQALRALPGQVAAAVGASPAGAVPAPAAAMPNPAATAIEYGLIAALLPVGVMATVGPMATEMGATFTGVPAVLVPVAQAIARAAAAVEPVVKAIADTPIVAAATAAIAPVVNQVAVAVNGAADSATAAVQQVATAATAQVGATLDAVQSAALAQQVAAVAGNPALLDGAVTAALNNPALLTSVVPVLASNPALATSLFGLLAGNPQLVTSLVAQVQNNPALAAQLMAVFTQLQASNPALAAQLVDMATQLANELGIVPAA